MRGSPLAAHARVSRVSLAPTHRRALRDGLDTVQRPRARYWSSAPTLPPCRGVALHNARSVAGGWASRDVRDAPGRPTTSRLATPADVVQRPTLCDASGRPRTSRPATLADVVQRPTSCNVHDAPGRHRTSRCTTPADVAGRRTSCDGHFCPTTSRCRTSA